MAMQIQLTQYYFWQQLSQDTTVLTPRTSHPWQMGNALQGHQDSA